MTPDAFDVLGMKPAYSMDPAEIERAYLTRVASCHPDLARSDPARASEAATRAAALNQARNTLLNDEKRGWALLGRLWTDTQSNDNQGDRDELPDGFLLEMMETRLLIEEALASCDATRIEQWREWAQTQRAGYKSTIAACFARIEALSPDSEHPETIQTRSETTDIFHKIRSQLNAWRYIERLIEQFPA